MVVTEIVCIGQIKVFLFGDLFAAMISVSELVAASRGLTIICKAIITVGLNAGTISPIQQLTSSLVTNTL